MRAIHTRAKPALIVLGISLGATAALAATSYLDFVGKVESGNNPQSTSQYSSAMGEYQMTNAALQATGYQNAAGQWTGKDGINSQADYLNNVTAQTNSMTLYQQQDWTQIQAKGMTQYVGQTVNGVTMNQSAILDCSYVLGVGGCNSYLSSGGQIPPAALAANPNFSTAFPNRLAQASQTDPSAITNGQNTQVANNSTPTAPGGANGATGLGGNGGIYCNQQVAQLLVDSGRTTVDAATLLAENGQTGYTLLGGGDVLGAAGLGGGTGGTVGSFSQMSCLDNLLGGGLDIIFNPPSLSTLINMLMQAVCNQANNLISQMTQPLNQSIGQTASLGGFLPGLGSIGGMVGVSPNRSGNINVNVGGYGGMNASVGSLLSGTWQPGGAAAPGPSIPSSGFNLGSGLLGN